MPTIWFRPALAWAVLAGCAAFAQDKAKPQFEVASIKLVKPPKPPHGASLAINHGTASLDSVTLRQMIVQAYKFPRVLVLGGPNWYDTDQYDMMAKAGDPNATPDQIRQMVQSLLADLFKLAVHREKRDLPAYVLTLGKDGPKIKEAAASETTAFDPNQSRRVIMRKQPVSGLVGMLANMLDTPVKDETGLKGLYDFNLDWSRDPDGTGFLSPNPQDFIPEAVERLGLHMELKKESMEVLVVDHAERPTAN